MNNTKYCYKSLATIMSKVHTWQSGSCLQGNRGGYSDGPQAYGVHVLFIAEFTFLRIHIYSGCVRAIKIIIFISCYGSG